MLSFLFVHNRLPALSQAEEKKVSEKTLQTPLLPSPVADHVKCNILKAQLENASRMSAQVRGANAPSISRFRISSVPPWRTMTQRPSGASAETRTTSRDGSLNFIIFLNYILFLCEEGCRGPCCEVLVEDRGPLCESRLSPSTTWVPRIELRLSELASGTLTCSVVSLALGSLGFHAKNS